MSSRRFLYYYDLLFFSLLASLPGIAENMLPRFFFLKIGFSVTIILLILPYMKLKELLIISAVKTAVPAFLSGMIISPAFIFGLTGSLSSLFFMLLLCRLKIFSIIGISVAGAAVSNLVQYTVFLLFSGMTDAGLTGRFTGILLIFSVSAGIITAVASVYLNKFMIKRGIDVAEKAREFYRLPSVPA
ncbi:MAG: hypothetical protein A2096_08730 [Spirochaetes bacterium GWF1_41_5]|nr:MAG: hypothetical protein A2096_08730 [Spirochaetes bacterium GWF1_41_5]HBE03992.1 hypothetical protein [Spirochaetia bacterium]